MFPKFIKIYVIEIYSLVLFFAFLPFVLQINYLQNDEVSRYATVGQFIKGNFTLDPYLTATFYSQGFLATIWHKFFGASHYPVLTLLVSVGSIYILSKIIKNYLGFSTLVSILSSLLLLFNPIFLYSSFGFMTENYFIFFLLLSLYFFYSYKNNNKVVPFVLASIFGIGAFLARQVGLLIPLAYSIYCFSRKKYTAGILSLVIFVAIVWMYFNLFPRTDEMINGANATIRNLVDLEKGYSVIAMALSYIGILFLPFVILLISSLAKFSIKQRFIFLLLVILSALTFLFSFNPTSIKHISLLKDKRMLTEYNSAEFPYFGNVYTNKGFFTEDLAGTKYHYKGFFALFRVYNFIAPITIVLLTAYFISVVIFVKKSELFSLEFIILILNLGILILLPKIYDRYLLPLFPLFILFCLRIREYTNINILEKIFLSIFILGFMFLGYQYSMDFLLVNKYVSDSSNTLIEESTLPNKIRAGNAWGMLYPNDARRWEYYFEYKGTEKQTPGDTTFEFVNRHKIDFPLSIYIDPYIYLYKRK